MLSHITSLNWFLLARSDVYMCISSYLFGKEKYTQERNVELYEQVFEHLMLQCLNAHLLNIYTFL